MDSDEREIFHFLKSWGREFIGAKEIARRAGGKKRFHENPDWAKPLLVRMAERGILEGDAMGRYRLKPVKKSRATETAAEKIETETADGELAPDDYYEQL